MLIPPGWREIVRTARDAADERFVDGPGGAVDEATGLDGRGRRLLLSASPRACPDDPVRLAGTPTRTTRCPHCPRNDRTRSCRDRPGADTATAPARLPTRAWERMTAPHERSPDRARNESRLTSQWLRRSLLTKLRPVRRRRADSVPAGPHAPEGITTIGKGVVIEGEVQGGEDLVIDGKVDGTIELPQHVLTVGPTGSVKAPVWRWLSCWR